MKYLLFLIFIMSTGCTSADDCHLKMARIYGVESVEYAGMVADTCWAYIIDGDTIKLCGSSNHTKKLIPLKDKLNLKQ